MRKFLSLMLCILLLMTTAVPASAEESDSQPPVSAPTEHTHAWTLSSETGATCTTAGAKNYACSCGATMSETIAATGHAYGALTNDGTSHSRVCGTCGTVESAAHSWGEGTVTLAPTCTAAGSKTYTCGCGATTTETLSMVAHTYPGWTVTDASHSRACSVCGHTESGAHSWGEGVVSVPATCASEGVVLYTCSGCGEAGVELLPMLTTHTYDNVCDPDCNVCGATRDADHKFSKVWSKNSGGHWHACVSCGEKADMGKHFPGPAATEEKAQICLTCGYTMTAKLNHSHDYAAQWTSDSTGHWYACDGCDEQKDFEEHSYDDPCDPDCNDCGYLTDTAHSYDGTWQSDEIGHWSVCTLCKEESEPQEHVPGPEATETEPQLCTVCNYELAPVQEHVHEAGEEWLTDEENHWKECQCGEALEKAPHVWDEGTENEDTTITYVCTECQAEKTEGEPKEAGNFPWWIVVVVALVGTTAAAAVILIQVLKKKSGKFHK